MSTMSRDFCERELDVMAAIDGDRWSDDLLAHVAGCGACQQVQTIGAGLLACVREEVHTSATDASDLWWRARLDARRDARRRAMQPLETIERAEPLVAVAALAAVLLLRGDVLLSALGPGSVQIALPGLLVPVLVGGLVATALMLLVGLGAAFGRD